MSTSTDRIVSTRVTYEHWHQLKMMAAEKDLSIRVLVEKSIVAYLKNSDKKLTS